jgi:hypothetical protein
MEFEGYNGDSPEALLKRVTLVASLSKLIEIPDGSLRKKMEQSADALDAVLCAFAAIAVSTGKLAQPLDPKPFDVNRGLGKEPQRQAFDFYFFARTRFEIGNDPRPVPIQV